MSMSKQDFEAIAEAIRWARKDVTNKEPNACHKDMLDGISLACEHIADACRKANPRFDRARFLAACGVQE